MTPDTATLSQGLYNTYDILLHRILTSLSLSWPDHISCPTKRTSEGYSGLGASNLCLRLHLCLGTEQIFPNK